jgi:hypothetical protein
MHSSPQSFQSVDCPTHLAFELTLTDGTTAAFSTTGTKEIEIGERYWNSYDGELYRVTMTDDALVEVMLEFGCGQLPRTLTFDRAWFTPDSHRLHHVTPHSS